MKIGLAFESNPSTYTFFDVGSTTSDGWNLKTIDLSAHNGEKISIISLFFEGGFGNGYEIKEIGRAHV